MRTGLLLAAAAALAACAAAPSTAAVVNDETAACAALGPKHPGSAADQAMGERVAEGFRAAGLETTVEPFHLPSFAVHAQSVAVTAPKALAVRGETFAYGGVGTVEAEVVDVGTGRPSDYSGVDAKDKIVMVDRNESYHRSSQLNEVVAHGGAAMLYVSGSPANLIQTGAVRFAQDMPAPILAMTVGADDGKAIRALKSQGTLKMRLSVDATRDDVLGRNVIGVRRGTTYPDRYVVVGGHYDSWYAGAVDNCSGAGSLLALADATKGEQFPYTVIFAAWDAEEVGLVGSYDWVMRHPDLVARTVLDENLEMTSAATYLGSGRVDASLINLMFGTTSPALNALVYESAARNGFAPAPSTAAGVRSISGGIIPTDLQPFYTAGVQGFSTYSSTPYYHTTEDTPDKIDPPSHVRVTSYLEGVLRDVGSVPPDALMQREVPTVTVKAPPSAAPGAAAPVEVSVIDPAGQPVTGATVKLLANQRDHWAVASGVAQEVGGGRYRWTLPAGATESDRTAITATVDPAAYAAQGYAFIDQRASATSSPSAAARACAASDGLTIARATARGRGARLEVRAAGPGSADVDVFQEARGRRVVHERRVARFRDRAGAFTWSARAVPDGAYLARFTVRFADGRRAVRRVALLRRGGRFTARRDVQRKDRCGLLRSFKLERPVFGGSTRAPLGISFRLGSGARVTLTLARHGRVVKRLSSKRRAGGRTYRVKLIPRGLRAGDYTVRLRVQGGPSANLTARAL